MTTPLCQTLRHLAQQTWNGLEDSHGLSVPLGETAITDYLLLDLRRSHTNAVRIWKINPRQEAKWGGDWAWWFVADGRSYGLLVQAKVLDLRTMRYEHLSHVIRKSKKRQVDVLIRSAAHQTYNRKRYQLQPAYCFYNYWRTPSNDPVWQCSDCISNPRWYGCAIADARRIKDCIDNRRVGLADIADESYAWSCLVCCTDWTNSRHSLPDRVQEFGENLLRGGAVPEVVDGVPEYIGDLLKAEGDQDRIATILRKVRVAGVVMIKE